MISQEIQIRLHQIQLLTTCTPPSNALMEEPSNSVVEAGKEATVVMAVNELSPRDPDNPLNWPIYRRIYVSAASFAFSFVV